MNAELFDFVANWIFCREDLDDGCVGVWNFKEIWIKSQFPASKFSCEAAFPFTPFSRWIPRQKRTSTSILMHNIEISALSIKRNLNFQVLPYCHIRNASNYTKISIRQDKIKYKNNKFSLFSLNWINRIMEFLLLVILVKKLMRFSTLYDKKCT